MADCHALLLPEDPDRSAREIHRELKNRTGVAIPVIITDSFGRPWREGLVDHCIGIAGDETSARRPWPPDPHGYQLHASIEAVADELAAAAGLVCGKLNRTPACIVRGFRYELARGKTRDLLRSCKHRFVPLNFENFRYLWMTIESAIPLKDAASG